MIVRHSSLCTCSVWTQAGGQEAEAEVGVGERQELGERQAQEDLPLRLRGSQRHKTEER